MDLREEIIDCFQIYDSKLLTDAVLTKCEELCNKYSLTADDLAIQWAAYSANHVNGLDLTIEGLLNMERKDFTNANKNGGSAKKVSTSQRQIVDSSSNTNNGITETSTPKSTRSSKRICSPLESTPKRIHNKDIYSTPQLSQSPIISVNSISLTANLNEYADRTNSGTISLSYGSQNLLHKALFSCNEKDMQSVKIEKWPEGHPELNTNTHYMYEVMSAKAHSLNSMTEHLGHFLLRKYALAEPTPFTKSSSTVVSYGRICCDVDGKLNAASVLLESTQELGRGSTIPLNLSKLQSYALFPGQVVAVEGFNPTGNQFVVQKLYTDASPTLPLPSIHHITFKEPLHIIAAAAPFTLFSDLQFQPLQDLLKYVENNRPHVIILIGPFLDESHNLVSSEDGMIESFNVFFENLVQFFMTPLESSKTQVVLVPSQKDAFHYPVYPTPPYEIRKKFPNLHIVADPSLLNIEGLIVGVTSVDILVHLGKEEVSLCPGGDRMSRLASHLFSQQCFYPLYPPDDDIAIDHELLEQHGILDVIPHILIVPSSIRHFIKHIGGCTVINPERLTKGNVGGTFVQIQINPPKENGIVADNIVAKVVRI